MKISTIVPAYNCEPFLRRAIESLLATNYPDLQIVIVDDGSHDGTLALARTLQSESPGIIQVLTHPGGVNRGVSASRNLGINASDGELIAFLDADDFVYPWRFESAVAQLAANSSIDGVHQVSQVVFSDGESSRQWWGGEYTLFGFTTAVPASVILETLLKGCCWATSAILFRRRLLAVTGAFHESLRTCEDCHLWFRMAACGRLVSGDLSRPVSAYYRRSDSAFQPSPRQRMTMIRAMTSFYHWLRIHDPLHSQLPIVSICIAKYILNGIVMARDAGDRRLAWQLASRGAIWFPQLLRYRELYGHVSHLALMH